jgi:hypothetical protein
MCDRPTASPGITFCEHGQRRSARCQAGNRDGARVNGTRIHYRNIGEEHRENVARKAEQTRQALCHRDGIARRVVPRATAATFCGNWLRVGNDGAALRDGAGKLGEICAESSVTPSGGNASAVRATPPEFTFRYGIYRRVI